MGLTATCCMPERDESVRSGCSPKQPPVRVVRFVSPVSSLPRRVRKKSVSVSGGPNAASNSATGLSQQSGETCSSTWIDTEVAKMTTPSEYEASPSPEVCRHSFSERMPWSHDSFGPPPQMSLFELDAAPGPEIPMRPPMNWRTSGRLSTAQASTPDFNVFELPTTPTRTRGRHRSSGVLYHEYWHGDRQNHDHAAQGSQRHSRSSHVHRKDPVSPLSDSSATTTDHADKQVADRSPTKVKRSSARELRSRPDLVLMDLPMQLANSLECGMQRNSNSKAPSPREQNSALDLNAPWRSSRMKNGVARPVSVSQSQYGRYHVFTILVEKDSTEISS